MKKKAKAAAKVLLAKKFPKAAKAKLAAKAMKKGK